MKKYFPLIIYSVLLPCFAISQPEKLIYHDIRTDAGGNIIPWYNPDPGVSYDHIIGLVWNFWDTIRTDPNGLPYYMNHQVWKEKTNDPRGLGGDQLNMALSSWRLLYAYSGNERIKDNMRFMADYYLTHGSSPGNGSWPYMPYPYNTSIYSGIYDGDMIIGKGFIQPDKAGAFGFELLNLYKMAKDEPFPNISDDIYLLSAINIANTLASKIKTGNDNESPLPFKVNALTGQVGDLKNNNRNEQNIGLTNYTSNWSGTMELFLGLMKLKMGDTLAYQKAFNLLLSWMKNFPLKTNKWGPFFEDVPGWSDTQINAVTFAQFMMNHPEFFPDWKTAVKGIFDWVYTHLGNEGWKKYGVIVVNEQTAYKVPGNSHTSRQASAELQYVQLSGDRSHYENAVRQLNWATYMVDDDGKNRYPQDDIWLTDGYGDYIRHFLRAMDHAPELAPASQDHLLGSTSVIQHIEYAGKPSTINIPAPWRSQATEAMILYRAFDASGEERIRMREKPGKVLVEGKSIAETKMPGNTESYSWIPMGNGGLLILHRLNGNRVLIGK